MSAQTGLYIGALLTIMAWSYLYKENPLFRFTEHLYIGLVTAYGVGYTYHNYLVPIITKDIVQQGGYSLIIPAVAGLLIYARYIRGWVWLSRIPMAFWIGYGAGYSLAYTPAVFMKQIFDSFIQLNSINNIIYFLVLVSAIMFFIFTVKKDAGPMKWGHYAGRYSLMVAFGSAFGSITMAYLSLIIGRLSYVLCDALHLIK